MRNLIGRGYHDCHVPAVIQRNVLENPAVHLLYALSAGDQPGPP